MSDKPRLPRSMIPASLICSFCERSFANELAYRQHMRAKHEVFYESMAAEERHGMSVEELRQMPDASQLEKLKPWMALAIAKHDVYGFTWDEVAEDMGRSAATLAEAARSPAGQRYRAELQDIMGDAREVVKNLLRSAQLEVYADWLAAFDWAKGARDYKAIHAMAKDIGLLPSMADALRDAGPQTLIVNLAGEGGLLQSQAPKTAFTVVGAQQQLAPATPTAHAEAEYVIEDK